MMFRDEVMNLNPLVGQTTADTIQLVSDAIGLVCNDLADDDRLPTLLLTALLALRAESACSVVCHPSALVDL